MNSTNNIGSFSKGRLTKSIYPSGIAVTVIAIIVLAFTFAACESTLFQSEELNDALEPVGKYGGSHLSGTISPNELNSLLAVLRAATAPHHRIEKAIEDGWNVQLTGCMEDPDEGGMGYHYGNLEFFDGRTVVAEPQALMYEPQKNGRMRLVGVEYIVPFSAEYPPEGPPPVLFGQEYSPIPALEIWALHVWAWRHNPSGMFADWNPMVSCKYD